MAWHAIESLDDALTATRELLLPFSIRRWLSLALVAFFVSGATALEPNASVPFGDGGTGTPPEPIPPGPGPGLFGGQLTPSQLQLLVAVAALALAVGLALAYVSAVMEFVFVEIARDRDVRNRAGSVGTRATGSRCFCFASPSARSCSRRRCWPSRWSS